MGMYNDFSDEERALLRSARLDERPVPAAARRRVLSALGLSASLLTTASGAAAGSSLAVASQATRALVLSTLKWAGIGVTATALALGARAKLSSNTTAQFVAPPTAAVREPVPQQRPPSPPPPAAVVMPTASPSPTVAAPRSPDSSSGTVKQRSSGLALEVASLDRIRSALAARDGSSALSLLDAHRSQFPDGALAPEATYLRVQALVLSGNRRAARDLATRFLAAYPNAPQAAAMKSFVQSSDSPHR